MPTQLTAHFSLEEFTRSDEATRLHIVNDPTPGDRRNLQNLAERLEEVRALFNSSINISSGYRNPELNAAVGGVPNSAHGSGHAADFHVSGLDDLAAAKRIRDSGIRFDQLIYEQGRCVHISFDPAMRRQVMRQPGGPNTPCFDGLE